MHSHTAKPLVSSLSGPLKGTLNVPSDKSMSHRAMLFGAIALGETVVSRLLESEDVMATAEAMGKMGAKIEKKGDVWHIHGVGVGGLLPPQSVLDFRNAGTGVRLTMGLVAGQNITASFDGDASLRKRPMGRVVEPLKAAGLDILESAEGLRLPMTIKGPDALLPIDYTLPVPSAQIKSALLLAGLNGPGLTVVREPIATRDHTERMLKAFGADITVEVDGAGTRVITLKGQKDLAAQTFSIPADPSSAAFATVAALITPGSEITLKDVMMNPTRTGLFTTLIEMGGDIRFENQRLVGGEDIADVVVKHSPLKGITVPADRAPSMIDEYPVLAVAAAFASGETRMIGLEELRVKESDRLQTVSDGLSANGVVHEIVGDDLIVTGGPVKGGGFVAPHLDHRIAMSFLVMGLQSQTPVTLDDGAVMNTSYPGFVADMLSLGGKIEEHQ